MLETPVPRARVGMFSRLLKQVEIDYLASIPAGVLVLPPRVWNRIQRWGTPAWHAVGS